MQAASFRHGTMLFHGLWQGLVARTSHCDRSAVDLNKYTNTVTNDRAARGEVFPDVSYLFTKKLLFWRKNLPLLFVAVAVSTTMFLCAPSGLPVCSCSLLCQMEWFWDSLSVLSNSCPEASGSSPTRHLYCPPPVLPLTGLPALCPAFFISFSFRTESIAASPQEELSTSHVG